MQAKAALARRLVEQTRPRESEPGRHLRARRVRPLRPAAAAPDRRSAPGHEQTRPAVLQSGEVAWGSVRLREQRSPRSGFPAVHAHATAVCLGILGYDADGGPRLFLNARFALRRAAPVRTNEPALVLHDLFERGVVLRHVGVFFSKGP